MAINIAIDGPSASGKSTIAKALCEELGYRHLDTGAMYRCIGLKVKQTGTDFNNRKDMENLLNSTSIDFTDEGRVLLDGKDVSREIRENDISMLASDVSTKKEVRECLVAMQQKIAEGKGYIMDGRDIGTVVLPDAEVKIFLTADVTTRAKRRYLENKSKGISSNLRELSKEIIERDYQDTHRRNSPLRKADDAIEIDTSNLTINQVVDKIMVIVQERL